MGVKHKVALITLTYSHGTLAGKLHTLVMKVYEGCPTLRM